jgi:hypothetical protein
MSESNGNHGKNISFDLMSEWTKRNNSLLTCPSCGMEPEKLNWFEFGSSDRSWAHLAGRQGYYSSCPKCELKVQEIITGMS